MESTEGRRLNVVLSPAASAQIKTIKRRQGLTSDAEAVRWAINEAAHRIEQESREVRS